TFTFYDTNQDLEQGINPYTDIENFVTNSNLIHVKVTNTITGCWSKTSFQIYVNIVPTIPVIEDYTFCEIPSDGLGEFIFVTKDAEILNGQTGKRVKYYLSQEDADNRLNNINKHIAYQNISNPQTIYVRVENMTDEDCYNTSSFTIEVGTSPEYNQPINIFKCDDISNDASELFDLGPKLDEITQGVNDNLVVTFHTTQEDAENASNEIPLQFANTVNPQQIYVRIDNGTICASYTSFTLNVIQVAQANLAEPLQVCDTNYDGIAIFDLTLAEIEILDVRQDNIAISYYSTMEDLDNQTNPITNPTAYTNTSNPQTVFVRLTNVLVNCYLAIPLELIVNLPPVINPIVNVDICDNTENIFDLTEVNALIVNDTSNRNFSYYATASDALFGDNPLNTDYTYTATNTALHVRVENATTGCSITHGFNLRVRPLPTANTPNNLEACDDDFDGILDFDLTTQNTTILGGQNPSNFSVSYYNSFTDAETGTNALSNIYYAFNEEIIYVRVENNNTGCFSTTQFGVIIHPRPVVDIPDQIICLDNLPLLVSANTNNSTDTYLWSTNETTPEINISTIGTYSVTVTTEFGCTTTQVFNVTESQSANIEIVETIDFSDPNNITITVSGIGNYVYQIDEETPQESNVFENVSLGYHTITVIDLNGCLEVSEEVLVLDFPQFVTPNDDGYFDTWHITGVETLPGTIIYIYDRFGKQIHYLTSSSAGWNGMYNNEKMPSTDYWFVAHVKGGGYDFEAKGHFALKR
ncbi:MAG TPA: T9SS type B sorting domain-containing protein, partial [Aquaticitalea sp.]|nr:T9SS type B sorting domain-containing protein [Aquaticitalea sp.]